MHDSSTSDGTAPEAPVPPPRRRRRWWRIALVAAVLVGVVLALLPYAINLGPVREAVADAVSDNLRGTCRIERLAFSWRDGVTVEGLEIANPPGFASERPALRLRTATADVALGSLLFGTTRATASVDGLELFVEQGADGTTNLQQLTREHGERGGERPTPSPQPPPPTREPAMAFDLHLRNSRVEVRREGRLLETLSELECRAGSAGVPGRIEVEANARLSAGDVTLGAVVDPRTEMTDVRLTTHGLDLAAWLPLIEAFLPGQVTALAGKVDGELVANVRGGDRVELGGELVVAAPRLAGPIVRDMDITGERWTIAPVLTLGTGTNATVDASRFAVDLGFARIDGKTATAGTVAFAYRLDVAALAAFGGPMSDWLGDERADLEGELTLPANDLPADAAGWAKAVGGTATLDVPKFDIAGFALRDLGATATLANGTCSVTTGEPTTLDGGTLGATLDFDLTDLATVPAKLSLAWRGGQVHGKTTAALRYAVPLFAGLDPDVARVVGTCDLVVDLAGPALKGEGQSWLAWLDGWRGTGSLGLRDAAFVPATQLQGLLAPLGPLTAGAVPTGQDGRLLIDAFTAPFEVENGFVRTTASEWLAKGAKIGLSGKVALDGSLDYGIDLTALLRGHKDGDRVLKALNGALPATWLKGTLDAPSLKLPALDDIAKKLLEQQGKDLLKKGLEELIKRR